MTDDPALVDPTDRESVRRNLERFAGADAVSEREDGSLVADFRGTTHVTVRLDGRVETGMPLHEFSGSSDRLVFDHPAGELRVETDAEPDSDGPNLSYTFRRP
ncbi:hypothetical protein [Halosimplex sp. TS25]|uniref:hypothetical protein n=1 Tax=Halosimplex rarum TaxID=3396619 RepID=UPI0039EB72F2